MANSEHVAKLLEGSEAWNGWRKDNSGVSPDFSGVNFSGKHLSAVNPLALWDPEGVDFPTEPLSEIPSRINLRGADFRKAVLREVNLMQADLRKANLNGADLSEAYLREADLSGAFLQEAKLYLARLNEASMSDSDLRRASLFGTEFNSADLTRANFYDANLRDADLSHANLSETNLEGANLDGANFRSTRLHGAKLRRTMFANTDLSFALGLANASHLGPSTIGLDTLYKSGGHIPDIFLRGCGVPEHFIEYARSLVGQAIQFDSCFISYSAKDQEFAGRLHADLQAAGVRCWFATHDIQGGKKVHEQLDRAIQLHDRLLLILSHDSMESEWVRTEIEKARKREVKEQRRMLFPVRLVDFDTIRDWECFDADVGRDSAREIREYFIPDFSAWKDQDSYLKAFYVLLRDLKAEAGDDKSHPPSLTK